MSNERRETFADFMIRVCDEMSKKPVCQMPECNNLATEVHGEKVVCSECKWFLKWANYQDSALGRGCDA
jgi:hypothetical protein